MRKGVEFSSDDCGPYERLAWVDWALRRGTPSAILATLIAIMCGYSFTAIN